MFCAAGFFGAGGGVALQGFSLTAVSLGACAATVGSDGSVTGTDALATAWALPLQAGIGAGYWLRCTRLSGSIPGGGSSSGLSWVSLSASIAWNLNAPINGYRESYLQIQIASDSAGLAIVATGYITLISDRI